MTTNDDKLIYLDLEFISRKYEVHSGIDPNQKTTKSEGASAGLKALFANVGISTSESRTYSITSRQMFNMLWQELRDTYQRFNNYENHRGTEVLWMEGALTLAGWKEHDSDEAGYEFYQLNHGSERTAFLTDESYFSAGFSKIFEASPALKGDIDIPVLCLVRIMWNVEKARNYVACPYIIIESN